MTDLEDPNLYLLTYVLVSLYILSQYFPVGFMSFIDLPMLPLVGLGLCFIATGSEHPVNLVLDRCTIQV
jgi:hypothetical protein